MRRQARVVSVGSAPYHVVPDSEEFCAEGPQDYLRKVLKLVKFTVTGEKFSQAAVVEGTCAAAGYGKKSEKKCFSKPDAAIFMDDDLVHQSKLDGGYSLDLISKERYNFDQVMGVLETMSVDNYALGLCRASERVS